MHVHTGVMTGGNYMYRYMYIANRTGSYIVLGINQATYNHSSANHIVQKQAHNSVKVLISQLWKFCGHSISGRMISSRTILKVTGTSSWIKLVCHKPACTTLGVGRKRAWYLLFVHVGNYPQLNICSSNSGGDCTIRIHVIDSVTCCFNKYTVKLGYYSTDHK